MVLIDNESGDNCDITRGTAFEILTFKQKEGDDEEVYLEVQWFDGSRFRLGHSSLGHFRGDRPSAFSGRHGFTYTTPPKELVSSPCS